MNDPSNKIIGKHCVVINARLEKKTEPQNQSGFPSTNFVLQRNLDYNLPTTRFSNYLLLNILFYTGYTHHFLMPNAATIKSSRVLSMVALKPAV